MTGESTAVLYCRVSTMRQADEELPIQSQLDRCRAKAEQLGARVVRTFLDEGLSGQIDSRPQFQQSILFCEVQQPTYYVTWSTSRFARNHVDAGLYKRRLAAAGVQLVYVSMDIDRGTDSGWLTEGILELFDELYSRQVSADTRRSMVLAAQSGYWCGGATPYGYRPVAAPDNPKRKRLAVESTEAATVHRIFSLRAEGVGAKAIAVQLSDEGARNRGRLWTKSSVLALLRNETVIGHTIFGRRPRISGQQKTVSRDSWIVVPSHEPIIDADLWQKVQAAIAADSPTRSAESGSPRSTFLFTGLLRCGRCGRGLQIETAKGRSRRYEYYNCRGAQQGNHCPPRRLPARVLDDWLVDVICADVLTPAALAEVLNEMRELAGSWKRDQIQRRDAVLAQVREAQGRAAKLYEVMEQFGRDTPNLADLTRRLREHNERIRQLETSLQTIDDERPPAAGLDDIDVKVLSSALVSVIKDAQNPAKVRTFFAEFIQEIRVMATTVQIEYEPARLVGRPVHSKALWLPETDSNRRPSD